ncbi:MAG: secondary thiamine-phosphate synthase enzyme YjbQ [archaeon]|jgi:secondary thiamine-phosphate synthase enzyme|nr:secondary thiamine-phosphate synthase enzyme YjbQ [archaeon]
MIEIPVKTSKRNQFVDLTQEIQRAVDESGVKSGLCVVYCPHTTAAITINENADPSVQVDIVGKLSKLVPEGEGYSHAEGNSDSHIKSAIIGNSRIVLVQDKKLVLGQWEGIFFCEFDGPRERKLIVSVLSE